ncbi:MAG TPA: ATP-binding protein [Candidatus Limnocylindrales bacterium]|jgi:two-component system sensor histidine kinase KdpD
MAERRTGPNASKRPIAARIGDGARPAAAGASPTEPTPTGSPAGGINLSFRVLLTVWLLVSAVLPVGVFGVVVMAAGLYNDARVMVTVLIVAVVAAAFLGLLAAALAVASLTVPLRRITAAVERVAAGESSPPIHLTGEDELARLAESHNRIAAEAGRRNRELGALLDAIAGYNPADGLDALVTRTESDACAIYGLIDCRLRLVEPATVPVEETIPGDPRPVRANVRAGNETLGVLTGHLPATRAWRRADQDLLDLFASEVGVALRNAELFGQIESQNVKLLELDAAKDEFLRGVSHNLQTPLTSIRAYVDQLRSASDEAATDRRLQIVAEQADRLTRLVRQLLTVTRLEAGALRPEVEVIAVGPRIRRAWEALNAPGVDFELRDEARGWLAVADPDQLDQVLWALLDNAVKYGGRGGRVEVAIVADDSIHRLHVTITDHGPGVSEADRERLFTRFTRGVGQASGDGTGLGLYVSRELIRTVGGALWLEPAQEGRGAAFTLSLPGEPPGDES